MSAFRNRALRRRRADTRKVYSFETKLSFPRVSIHELRRIAAQVWVDRAPVGRRMPVIVAGRGVRYCGQWCSYCEGYTRIVLARHHRHILVLLHELTHALGPSTHGKRFQDIYADLLLNYAV